MLEDSQLIEACVHGDRQAQRHLFSIFSKKMYVVCLRYTKSQQEAEDILQDSFIKVFKYLKGYRGDCKLEFWIKRIVINTALNARRKKLYMYPMVDIEDVKDYADQGRVLSSFRIEELISMISELPTGCQTVFNLFAIEGYSHKEIAEMLDVSEGTSKSQFARARKLLQEKIAKEDKAERYEKFR
ncbi:MAG: RNA polymerase sigma factor [Cyclobacteriaceae bacterium]|nr:RNA polymerase sigma factor [Cyclobacteriaceae bacterium]